MARRLIKSWGDIAYDDDVILNVHEKFPQFTVKQIQIIYKFIFPYIKKYVKDPNCHMVRLSHLGNMYFKVAAAKKHIEGATKYIEKNPVAKTYKEKIEALALKVKNFDEYYDAETNGKPMYTVHKRISNFNLYHIMRCNNKEALEERLIKENGESR